MVTVFPNPANSELNIKTESIDDVAGEVTDVTPDEISLINISNSKSVGKLPQKSNIKLDIASIPDGDYMLNISVGKEVIQRHIIIKK